MNIGEIIKNSLGYPLSNAKNLLFFGLLICLADFYSILQAAGIKSVLLSILVILTLFVGIFRYGYHIRILERSIEGSDTLPDFGNWKKMFIDGLKVIIVNIFFAIPLIIILVIAVMLLAFSHVSSGTALGAGNMFGSILVIMVIAGLYLIIIYPILLLALANMAHNKKLDYAFKFGEIKSKIEALGLGKLIGWYLSTGIIYIALLAIGMGLVIAFRLIHVKVVGQIIYLLIFASFASIFLYRSTSLLYRSTLEHTDEAELSEESDIAE